MYYVLSKQKVVAGHIGEAMSKAFDSYFFSSLSYNC